MSRGGIAAILLAGVINDPGVDPGQPYLFGPIAAVVLAGTSLTGGLASATSTWIAAFALTLLNQMLRVLGLTTALQFVVFGGAIIVGMVISGDRIATSSDGAATPRGKGVSRRGGRLISTG